MTTAVLPFRNDNSWWPNYPSEILDYEFCSVYAVFAHALARLGRRKLGILPEQRCTRNHNPPLRGRQPNLCMGSMRFGARSFVPGLTSRLQDVITVRFVCSAGGSPAPISRADRIQGPVPPTRVLSRLRVGAFGMRQRSERWKAQNFAAENRPRFGNYPVCHHWRNFHAHLARQCCVSLVPSSQICFFGLPAFPLGSRLGPRPARTGER